jgi:hypothetical protein
MVFEFYFPFPILSFDWCRGGVCCFQAVENERQGCMQRFRSRAHDIGGDLPFKDPVRTAVFIAAK